MAVRAALQALERFLLPNGCVACDRTVEGHAPDALLCGVCRSRLRPLVGGCARCRQPLPPVGPCRFCADWPAITWAASAVWLTPAARAVVHGLKYEGLFPLADECAAQMLRTRHGAPAGWLVPVPLTARRQAHRGYNQAALIARALGRRWRRPVVEQALARVRETRTQTDLTPAERAENVADAFLARPPVGNPPAVILVDDVLTTGATLSAAAHALQRAGWPAIGAFTFARAEPYERRLDRRPAVSD